MTEGDKSTLGMDFTWDRAVDSVLTKTTDNPKDVARIRLTPAEAKQRLREGDPVVEVHSLGLTDGHLELTAWVLEADQVAIVGRRVREVLEAAS